MVLGDLPAPHTLTPGPAALFYLTLSKFPPATHTHMGTPPTPARLNNCQANKSPAFSCLDGFARPVTLCSLNNTSLLSSYPPSPNLTLLTHLLRHSSGVTLSRKPSLMPQAALCVPKVHHACLQPCTQPTRLHMSVDLSPPPVRKLLQGSNPFLHPRAYLTHNGC